MKRTEVDAMCDVIKSLLQVHFENRYGEKFTLRTNGTVVLISGSEVDSMVDDKHKICGKYIQLFNDAFSIWSIDELRELGYALVEIANKYEERANESKLQR